MQQILSTAAIIGLAIGVTLLCLGAVMWANGEFELNANCSAKKAIDTASGLFTETEVEARYNACVANANAQVRWSMPLCLIGAVIVTVFLPVVGSIYFARRRAMVTASKKSYERNE